MDQAIKLMQLGGLVRQAIKLVSDLVCTPPTHTHSKTQLMYAASLSNLNHGSTTLTEPYTQMMSAAHITLQCQLGM